MDKPVDNSSQGATQPPAPATVHASGGRITGGQTKLAETFVNTHSQSFRYVHGVGWYQWDQTRWRPCRKDEQREAIKNMNVTLATQAIQMGDKTALREHMSNMSSSALAGALTIAQSSPTMALLPDDLDSDAYLLNTANGLLDLVTGNLRPSVQEDLVSRQTNAAFVPDVDQSIWLRFLERVLPDPDVRGYLQRYMGVSLLGKVQQHVFAIATGVGANGKSTIVEAFRHALGDYAHITEPDLFIATRGGSGANGPKPAIFALMNRRVIFCSETEAGAKLAPALMKQLTGGDEITARNLHSTPVTFTPTWTTLMVTNHLPKVQADDDALWRRIRIIPFDVVIPKSERDPHLTDTLKLHADAILAWAYEGLQQYVANGYVLDEPAAVMHATQKYRNDSDDYAKFLTEALDLSDPDARTSRSDLWQEWEQFVRAGGAEARGKPQDFYAYLETRGCKPCKMGPSTNRVRAYSGVSIVSDQPDPQLQAEEELLSEDQS